MGVNEVILVCGFNYCYMSIDDYYCDHFGQLIVGIEMGSYKVDLVKVYVFDQDIIYFWWVSLVE